MNIKLNLFEDLNFPSRATLRSSLVPMFTLSLLALFVPYCIRAHSIYTTQYIVGIMFGSVFVERMVYTIVDHHTKIVDWLLTSLVLLVGVPVSVSCGIIGLIVIFIFPRSIYFVGWLVATITIFMLGVRLIYDGEFPKHKGAFIVAGNHSSFLDYFLIAHVMGYKPWTIVYGTNLHKYPIIRYFGQHVGIGVNRKDLNSRTGASEQIKNALSLGLRVAVFPEGTRMRSYQMDQKLLPFKNGSFSAACDCGVGIQPVVFDWPILFSKPDRPLPLSPRTIKISFLDFTESDGKNRKDLSFETFEHIEKALS